MLYCGMFKYSPLQFQFAFDLIKPGYLMVCWIILSYSSNYLSIKMKRSYDMISSWNLIYHSNNLMIKINSDLLRHLQVFSLMISTTFRKWKTMIWYGIFRYSHLPLHWPFNEEKQGLVLATVPDRHFTSGAGSKPNRCQIGGPGCQ